MSSMIIVRFILLPLLIATSKEIKIGQFLIQLDNGILQNILPVENITEYNLDISNLGICQIESQAFDNLINLKSLDLSKNSLITLPEFIFANLTKLTNLSLANNNIQNLENVLVGLQNLHFLNLSYTRIRHLRRGHLFSLPESAKIITEGNIFQTLSNVAFDNPFLKSDSIILEEKRFEVSRREGWEINLQAEEIDQLHKFVKSHPLRETEVHLDKNLRVKMCSEDGIINSLEELEKDEIISDKCIEVPIDYEKRRVILKNLGIEDFDRDWYRLQKLRILELDLSQNEIAELNSEVLNDLPGDLHSVNLMGNNIKSIKRHIIENGHLKVLIMSHNDITDIEEGAFEHMKLTGLYLSNNNIKCLKFCKTLPSTLTELSLTNNNITHFPEDSFAGLPNLLYLSLRDNKINKINKDTFRGLRSLSILDITKNELHYLEPGAFRNLHSLNVLNLYRNSIFNIEKGTFEGLASLKTLNLAWNKIQNITKYSFSELPMTLDYLYLDFNEIWSLEAGSFMAVPRITLSLDGNQIEYIPKAAFDMPFLQNLHLHNNSLKAMDGDAYIRIPYLKKLWLGNNKIQVIEKGATRNLGYLSILDISKNPIKRLENGVFYGLPKFRGHFVYFGENQIEVIEGGVFEDY